MATPIITRVPAHVGVHMGDPMGDNVRNGGPWVMPSDQP